MEIDILIEAEAWDTLDLEVLTEAAVRATLGALDLDSDRCALSVLAADDKRIAALNADFRGKPVPTNVLSWPAVERSPEEPGAMPKLPDSVLGSPPQELGDIALAFETCAREARESNKPLSDHITHLVVHGLMHCLGFDHETDEDAALMEQLETRILATLGVPDPY
ncbi:rRNA maturation RNase YbeY [Gymnodinialimonas hymeniacidonis]|uniref:rRNA maturation RNase YbeY n=1 Tax=Gymnodinialimonas hymeniacidonis TaxID=3126508 RepID=UPI0034C5F67E